MHLSLGHEHNVPDVYATLGAKKRRAKREGLAWLCRIHFPVAK